MRRQNGSVRDKIGESTRAGRNGDLAMRTTRASGSSRRSWCSPFSRAFARPPPARKRKARFFRSEKHNQLRSLDSPRLVWSQDLAGDARPGPASRRAGCRLQRHLERPGENLAVGRPIADAVQDWYDEIRLYDHAAGLYSPDVGHYTSRLEEHRRLGCAFSVCRGGNQWAVSASSCAGTTRRKLETQFLDNVLPPSSGKFPKEGPGCQRRKRRSMGISGVSDFFGNIGNVFGNIGNAFGGRALDRLYFEDIGDYDYRGRTR